jgi:hypothetical protein
VNEARGETERGARGSYRRRRATNRVGFKQIDGRKFCPAQLSPPVIAAGG